VTEVYRQQSLSNIFLFNAHILSHSIKLLFFEGPYSNINSVKASTVIPLLMIPLTVGNLGSSHPETIFSSTNQLSFLFDSVVFTKFNLEKS